MPKCSTWVVDYDEGNGFSGSWYYEGESRESALADFREAQGGRIFVSVVVREGTFQQDRANRDKNCEFWDSGGQCWVRCRSEMSDA